MSALIITLTMCVNVSPKVERERIDATRSAFPQAYIVVKPIECQGSES
jgi:hypothetical protein